MIYRNQATSLARDIAVRFVIGLHKSDHVTNRSQQPMYIEVTLLYRYKCEYIYIHIFLSLIERIVVSSIL